LFIFLALLLVADPCNGGAEVFDEGISSAE
jgi:hypothetical protein